MTLDTPFVSLCKADESCRQVMSMRFDKPCLHGEHAQATGLVRAVLLATCPCNAFKLIIFLTPSQARTHLQDCRLFGLL